MISIKVNRAVGGAGAGAQWGSVLRCRCWDCGAIRRSLLRRALQLLALAALAGLLRQVLPYEVVAVRHAGAPGSVTQVL